ncbi:PREDICTED: uncharacterized protein LOC104818993 [Tarenaya hassleriana]|uniref:uncharacterized protein LOC104818993 n=1 Tax=Tarenaya hassleriana TaxID=28532 RepID=UPI00053C85D1|nr:PREDICTED: uncharacterized protein LOC104818993 [Tarenaya hassleriana]
MSLDAKSTENWTLISWVPKVKTDVAKKILQKKTGDLACKSSTEMTKDPKKVCLCSPTAHDGSFRCHLHRTTTGAAPTANPKTTAVKKDRPPLSRLSVVTSSENTE